MGPTNGVAIGFGLIDSNGTPSSALSGQRLDDNRNAEFLFPALAQLPRHRAVGATRAEGYDKCNRFFWIFGDGRLRQCHGRGGQTGEQ
jgi:hypothetical protein